MSAGVFKCSTQEGQRAAVLTSLLAAFRRALWVWAEKLGESRVQVWSHRCSSLSVLCEENKTEINSFFVSLSVVLAACWWFLFLPRLSFGRRCEHSTAWPSANTHLHLCVDVKWDSWPCTDVRWHRLCPPWGMTSLSPRLSVCVCVCHSIYSNRHYFLGSGTTCVSIVFPSCALESCSAAAGVTKTTADLLA